MIRRKNIPLEDSQMIVFLQLMVDVVLSFSFHLSSSLHFKYPMNTRTSSHHELMFSKGLHVKNLALNLVLLGREGNFKGQSVVQEACPGGGTGTLAPSCLFLSFLVAMRKAGLLCHVLPPERTVLAVAPVCGCKRPRTETSETTKQNKRLLL